MDVRYFYGAVAVFVAPLAVAIGILISNADVLWSRIHRGKDVTTITVTDGVIRMVSPPGGSDFQITVMVDRGDGSEQAVATAFGRKHRLWAEGLRFGGGLGTNFVWSYQPAESFTYTRGATGRIVLENTRILSIFPNTTGQRAGR